LDHENVLRDAEMSFIFPTEIVEEGDVNVLVPQLEAFKRATWDYAPSKAPVFYNPAMELNRDIAVLALQTYQKIIGRELSVSEPLASCGIRGIRLAKEVKRIRKVFLNDINPEAVKLARYNVHLNELDASVSTSNEDANLFLSRYAAPHKRFDFIDIDPFGSPTPYMDSAIRALRDGGLLALTATDLAPLCGVHPKVALRKYGGSSLRTEYRHEIAVRLLAGCLVMTAARHEIGVTFPFSHSTDHYIRVYALAEHGAKKADESIQRMGYILHCFKCFHRETFPGIISSFGRLCNKCGSPLSVAGPLWLGKIFDRGFCELMEKEATARRLRHKKRIMKLLSLIKTEADGPITYYAVDRICDKLNISVPPLREVIKKLGEKGFRAVPTHFHGVGFRTDAPAKIVIETVKEAV